jgi:hypothetical protein
MAEVTPIPIDIRFDSRSLVIGMGEIGSALYRVLKESKSVFCRDLAGAEDFEVIDVLHICFPYSDNFIESVVNYIEHYNPALTIVYSTVPIGTCEEIGPHIVHSPIEGKHPRLEQSIQTFPRWLGCPDNFFLEAAVNFWKPLNRIVRPVSSSQATEYLKLMSTSRYGLNLAWADYEDQVASSLNIDYSIVNDFNADYNYLYQKLGMPGILQIFTDASWWRDWWSLRYC